MQASTTYAETRIHLCAQNDIIGGLIDAKLMLARDHNDTAEGWQITDRAMAVLKRSPAFIEMACADTISDQNTLLDVPIDKAADDLPKDGSFILVGGSGVRVRVVPVFFPVKMSKAA